MKGFQVFLIGEWEYSLLISNVDSLSKYCLWFHASLSNYILWESGSLIPAYFLLKLFYWVPWYNLSKRCWCLSAVQISDQSKEKCPISLAKTLSVLGWFMNWKAFLLSGWRLYKKNKNETFLVLVLRTVPRYLLYINLALPLYLREKQGLKCFLVIY